MQIDFSTLDKEGRYKLISNSIYPRPIAWIVTENDGVVNIAPFSFFAPVSSNPPVVVVGFGKKDDGSPKDTLKNILKTKKATICIPNQTHLQSISQSAIDLPSNKSESEEFNIETQTIYAGFPPIITGVHAAFFVTLRDTYAIEDGETLPAFLNIHYAYFDDLVIASCSTPL